MPRTLTLALAMACRAPAAAQTPVARSWPVPETPVPTTDSVWGAVTASANLVTDDAGRSWVWNAMYVGFRDGAPREVRQALFDSVGARAVGGTTLAGRDLYLVTLDGWHPTAPDSALRRLIDLANRLRARPAVRGVMTISVTEP